MPETDRTWKVLLISSWLLIAGATIYALGVVLGAGIDAITQGGSIVDHLDFGQLWQAIFLAFGGFATRSQAAESRKRATTRAKLLTGDSSALPLAHIPLDASAAPDDAHLPLEYTWRGAGLVPRRSGCILLLIFLLPLGILGAIVSFLVFGDIHPPIGVSLAVPLVGGAAAGIFILFVGKRYIEGTQRRATGRVVATKHALLQARGKRPPLIIPWADARLLEVVAPTPTQTFTRRFILQSAASSISWYVVPSSSDQVAGDEESRSHARQQTLLNLITARTGLLPRTLAPSLQQRDPVPVGTSALAPPHIPGWVYIIALLLIAALLALGTAALLVPLTDIIYLNSVVAASFAVPAVYLLVAILWQASRQRQLLHSLAYTLPIAPALVGSTALHVNTVSPSRRLLNGGMALLFMLDFPAIIVGYTQGISRLPQGTSEHLPEAMNWLFAGVLMVALVGFMYTARTLTARAARVFADSTGLKAQTGNKTIFISWAAVERVEVASGGFGEQAFKIIAGDDGRTISWHTSHARRFEPPSGALRVTAEELAAIVCQHSGKPLTRASAG